MSSSNSKKNNLNYLFNTFLILLVVSVISVVVYILWEYFQTTTSIYKDNIKLVQENKVYDTNSVIALSKNQDNITIKAATIMVGFILVFTGSLFLFKVINSSYEFSAENDKIGKVLLTSSSPGLILATLGSLIIIFGLNATNKFEYVPDVRFVPESQVNLMKLTENNASNYQPTDLEKIENSAQNKSQTKKNTINVPEINSEEKSEINVSEGLRLHFERMPRYEFNKKYFPGSTLYSNDFKSMFPVNRYIYNADTIRIDSKTKF